MNQIRAYYSPILAEDPWSSNLQSVESGILIQVGSSWISYRHDPDILNQAIQEIDKARSSEPDLNLLYAAALQTLCNGKIATSLFDPAFLKLEKNEAKLVIDLFSKESIKPEVKLVNGFIVIKVDKIRVKFSYIKTSMMKAIKQIKDDCQTRVIEPSFTTDGTNLYVEVNGVREVVTSADNTEGFYIYEPMMFTGDFTGKDVDISLLSFDLDTLLRFDGVHIDHELAKIEGVDRINTGFKILSCSDEDDMIEECQDEIGCNDYGFRLVFQNSLNLITLSKTIKTGNANIVRVDIYHKDTPQIFSSLITSGVIRMKRSAGDVPIGMLFEDINEDPEQPINVFPVVKLYDRLFHNQFTISLFGIVIAKILQSYIQE